MLIPQEYGDELYAANSHNTSEEQDPPSAFPTTLAENTDHGDHHGLEATGATAQYPFAAAENENGGGYQYTQEELDRYNAKHGAQYNAEQAGQHGGAPAIAPSSVCADENNSSSGAIPLPEPGNNS